MKTVKRNPVPLIALALIALLSPLAHAKRGTVDGGGGGGPCNAEGCKTLSQAGLRIVTNVEQSFMVSAVVAREVRAVVSQMPLPPKQANELVQETIGLRDTFEVVAAQDAKKFAQYKKWYLDLLRVHGKGIDTQNFQLFAVSEGDKTYLIQDAPGSTFYDRLDTRGKALLLIHESFMRRNPGVELLEEKSPAERFRDKEVFVLGIDGLIQDILTGRDVVNAQVRLLSQLSQEDRLSEEARDTGLAMLALRARGGEISLSEICDRSVAAEFNWGLSSCVITPEKAASLQDVSPQLASEATAIFFITSQRGGGNCELTDNGKLVLEKNEIRYVDDARKCLVQATRGK